MTLADRKWLQGRLLVLRDEAPSAVAALDLSDGFGESFTRAILAAADSMSTGEDKNLTFGRVKRSPSSAFCACRSFHATKSKTKK